MKIPLRLYEKYYMHFSYDHLAQYYQLQIVVYFNSMAIIYPKHTINHHKFESNLKFRKCI